jgi:O-antigen/teichoic acid export membrane protein
MKQKARQILKHPLISKSIVMFIGTLLANIINFLFNLFMIKSLTKVDYGVLQSLLSIIALTGMAASATIPLLINFGGTYFAKKDYNRIKKLYKIVGKFFFASGLSLFVIFLIFIPNISQFFHIENYPLLILTDFTIFMGYIFIINHALLNAGLKFNFYALLIFLISLLKLIFGIILVLLGFSVSGAIGAILISSIITYILSFIPLSFLFKKQTSSENINTKELLKYGIPSAIVTLGLTSLISTDIILVKHFFGPDIAGEYSGLSLIGKIIFFFSAPIGTVMFPLIVQKYNKKENFTNTFKLSLLLVSLPSICLVIFYYFFPHFVITFFAKKEYLSISQYITLFSIFISMYTLVSLLTNLYLAINKTKIWIPVSIAALAQASLIWFNHQSILDVILISLGTTFLLLIVLLLYYPYATKK